MSPFKRETLAFNSFLTAGFELIRDPENVGLPVNKNELINVYIYIFVNYNYNK